MSNNDEDPAGICAIYEICYNLYPNQPTPPQVSAIRKFWCGGLDPLDFISMYENIGCLEDSSKEIVASHPHWHYVSYGLSDLYGDSRLHCNTKENGPSGFGFELTFRLRKYSENKAPLWPAMLLQSLARYLFRSQAKFAPGDHIPWGKPIEEVRSNNAESDFELDNSRIVNMLICSDPQLPRIETSHGYVDFLQVVGACDDEIKLSRMGDGLSTLERMSKHTITGGKLLVTDTRRCESILDLDSSFWCGKSNSLSERSEGSTMSGVTTEVSWSCWVDNCDEGSELDVVGDVDELNDESVDNTGDDRAYECSHHINSSIGETSSPFYGIKMSPSTLELYQPQFIDKLHLKLSKDSAEIMSFVINYRLKFGRHFTFLHCRSDIAVTLVTEGITGSFVNADKPFGFRGNWLQIYVNSDCLNEFDQKFAKLTKISKSQLPFTMYFPNYNISISIDLP